MVVVLEREVEAWRWRGRRIRNDSRLSSHLTWFAGDAI